MLGFGVAYIRDLMVVGLMLELPGAKPLKPVVAYWVYNEH